MSSDFYGSGAAYPWRVDGTGGIAESTGVRKVEEAIRILLGTQYGERVMRPDYGCNLRSLTFAPNDAATANLARHYVEEGLRRWEPRIDVVDVSVVNDQPGGRLLISLRYRLRSTQDAHSFVYPFYLEKP